MSGPICESCFKEIDNPSRGDRTVTHPRQHIEIYKRGCLCCSCRRRRSNRTNPRIEIMQRDELRAVLSAAKRQDPWVYIAFRLAVNGMLTGQEVVSLKRSDIVRAEPCEIRVRGSTVPIECGTIDTLEDWLGDRKGRIFNRHVIGLYRAFDRATKFANVYRYKLSALRFTGIFLRGMAVRSVSDVVMLRRMARIRSLSGLRPFLPPSGLMDWMRRISWAK